LIDNCLDWKDQQMSFENILEELRSQRSQLDQAFAALQGTWMLGFLGRLEAGDAVR
jgi:hypothetical protein